MPRLAKKPVAGAALVAAVARVIHPVRKSNRVRKVNAHNTTTTTTKKGRKSRSPATSPIRATRQWSPEADLHIQCGEQLFPCNRQLISEASRSVKETLENSMPTFEFEHPIIEIDELSQACVHSALEYLQNNTPLNMEDFEPESEYNVSDSFREAAKYGADHGEAYAAYELCHAGHVLGSQKLQEYAMRCYDDARVRWWNPKVIASLCEDPDREDTRMMACKVRWLMFGISAWDKQVLKWQQVWGTSGELTELQWDKPESQWYPEGYDKETGMFEDGSDLHFIMNAY